MAVPTLSLLNQLEPAGLIQAFLRHPPQDFQIWLTEQESPAFSADFDLLTTIESKFRHRLMHLPLYRYWGKWLRPRTCFIGTTVSEYALLPSSVVPEQFVNDSRTKFAKHFPFLIIKDIPQDSPLLDTTTNHHCNALVQACKDKQFIIVEGQALAWVNINFKSIDDYLQRLSASRRKDIRRKLKRRPDLAIEAIASGSPCFFDTETLAHYYALYRQVYEQSDIHFDLLLPEFFAAILQDANNGGIIFTYRREDKLIGYNICFVVGDSLIDKYIGLSYPDARNYNLYFISWFHNLDYALQHGLTRYVAGWTDPEIKSYLGAQFTFTRHAVYIRNPLLRAVLGRLSYLFESDRQWREQNQS